MIKPATSHDSPISMVVRHAQAEQEALNVNRHQFYDLLTPNRWERIEARLIMLEEVRDLVNSPEAADSGRTL